ncbi:MAG: toxin-antitoxin system YwqK family antitoxin [Bacteroidia bacterium]
MLDKRNYANGQAVYELNKDYLTYFFKTGITKAEGPYVNSLMEGEWKFYRESGQLWQVGHFKNSMKHGKFIRYDKKGNIDYEEEFDEGKARPKRK